MNDTVNYKHFLEVCNVTKRFSLGKHSIEILKGVSLHAETGEWLALVGASGSGKTTLLDILGTISRPDSGSICLQGHDLLQMSHRELIAFRRKEIAFVFQAYHMLPELNICENVMLPALLTHHSKQEAKERALKLLDRVGLSHRVLHRANELSGGEQQRAAIARALMNSPSLLLADEPTGNLDSVTGSGILDLFKEFHADSRMTIIMVTHDHHVAELADRAIELKDGHLAG